MRNSTEFKSEIMERREERKSGEAENGERGGVPSPYDDDALFLQKQKIENSEPCS